MFTPKCTTIPAGINSILATSKYSIYTPAVSHSSNTTGLDAGSMVDQYLEGASRMIQSRGSQSGVHGHFLEKTEYTIIFSDFYALKSKFQNLKKIRRRFHYILFLVQNNCNCKSNFELNALNKGDKRCECVSKYWVAFL